MTEKNLIENKEILIVDDEPDVLDTLEGLLSECQVVRASSFDEARKLLESRHFDMAILDIMGVDGYKLLAIANMRKVTAVMLTGNAFSTEDTEKSYSNGAAFYVPKDEMAKISVYLNDILEAESEGQSPWSRWLDRFGLFYEKRFGADWQKKDKEFWDKFIERYGMW